MKQFTPAESLQRPRIAWRKKSLLKHGQPA